MSSPARIVCIPSSDATFRADVDAVAERIPGALPPVDALAWFTTELRRTFPTIVVREQHPLARVSTEPPVWYVSRRNQQFRIDTGVWVPLSVVDAYRVYVDRVAEWQTAVVLTPKAAGGAMVGTEYEATYSFLGVRYTGRFRVLTADPGRSVSIEAAGSGITVWYVTSFRQEDDGTRVRVRGDYSLPGNVIARIADRLVIERTIGRDIDRANESYRAMCEREAGTAERA